MREKRITAHHASYVSFKLSTCGAKYTVYKDARRFVNPSHDDRGSVVVAVPPRGGASHVSAALDRLGFVYIHTVGEHTPGEALFNITAQKEKR